jgi:hypothetical protein
MIDQARTLIARFVEAAEEKGASGGPRDHELHGELREILRDLKGLGPTGDEAFRSLLSHDSAHVQSWVAAQLLYEGEAGAAEVLEALQFRQDLVGFNARWTLRLYRQGKLGAPLVEKRASL